MELKSVLQLKILTADPEQDELCQGDKRNEDGRWPLHNLLPVCHAVEVLHQLGVIFLVPTKKMFIFKNAQKSIPSKRTYAESV